MTDYVLSCCSTADLSIEQFKARRIEYICFHYLINGKQYDDDLGLSMPLNEFYSLMEQGAETSTSQVNTLEFTEYFEGFLKKGLDVLHVCLSSGISGVYNSACVAQRELEKKYPERKIYIVDSLAASSGYGLLMDTLADLRDEGKSISEVYEYAENNKLYVHHWFFSTDLTFYVKGGRVSKASGWFGTALKICPLLNMDNLGRLIPRKKIRTKPRVIEQIVEEMKQHAVNSVDYSGKCFISHSGCLNDAEEVKALIEKEFKNLTGKVVINPIGTTIGSHTGPGTVALFFFGDLRTE